jgi:hypothetical protein
VLVEQKESISIFVPKELQIPGAKEDIYIGFLHQSDRDSAQNSNTWINSLLY